MENKKSKPLREWMQSAEWPPNAPDWSSLGKIDCISLEEALSMIASSSSMPILTRRYYNGAIMALKSPQTNTVGWHCSSIEGFKSGLAILEAQKAADPVTSYYVPEHGKVVKTSEGGNYLVALVSVAPDDYERMSKRDAAWTEMVEKLQALSGAVADFVLKMEKLK